MRNIRQTTFKHKSKKILNSINKIIKKDDCSYRDKENYSVICG